MEQRAGTRKQGPGSSASLGKLCQYSIRGPDLSFKNADDGYSAFLASIMNMDKKKNYWEWKFGDPNLNGTAIIYTSVIRIYSVYCVAILRIIFLEYTERKIFHT